MRKQKYNISNVVSLNKNFHCIYIEVCLFIYQPNGCEQFKILPPIRLQAICAGFNSSDKNIFEVDYFH